MTDQTTNTVESIPTMPDNRARMPVETPILRKRLPGRPRVNKPITSEQAKGGNTANNQSNYRKREEMRKLANALLDQYAQMEHASGSIQVSIRKIANDIGISWMVLHRWLMQDKDWLEFRSEVELAKRIAFTVRLERALTDHDSPDKAKISYIQGYLNRIDPEPNSKGRDKPVKVPKRALEQMDNNKLARLANGESVEKVIGSISAAG